LCFIFLFCNLDQPRVVDSYLLPFLQLVALKNGQLGSTPALSTASQRPSYNQISFVHLQRRRGSQKGYRLGFLSSCLRRRHAVPDHGRSLTPPRPSSMQSRPAAPPWHIPLNQICSAGPCCADPCDRSSVPTHGGGSPNTDQRFCTGSCPASGFYPAG